MINLKEVVEMIAKRLFIDGKPTRYLINTDGQIFSEYSCKYLKPFKNPQGYCLVDISTDDGARTLQLHRLVALAFIPNPEMLETVNHKDGNKENNAVSNLEWMTRLDNVRHAWRTGLAKPRYGVDNPANVYSEEQIHAVCQMLEVGVLSNKEIAEKCDVNVTLIRDIKFRGKWSKISSQYSINKTPIGFKHVRGKIIELIEAGYSNSEIFKIVKLPNMTKRHIEGVRARYMKKKLDSASTTNRGTS